MTKRPDVAISAARSAGPDPETGEVLGGLYGRSYLGVLFIDRFFLPEKYRGDRLGARLLAMAEEGGKRRGCAVIALFTLHLPGAGLLPEAGLRSRRHARNAAARRDPLPDEKATLAVEAGD